MDEAHLEDLVLNIKRASKANKPWYWGFVMKGPDGKAVLITERKEAQAIKAIRANRKTATDKKFAKGRVVLGEGGNLVFGVEEGSAKAKLIKKALMLDVSKDPGLKKVKALVRGAEVMETEAFLAMIGPDTTTESAKAKTGDTSEPEVDDTKLRKELAMWRKKAKGAYDDVKGRVDGKSFEAKLIERTKKAAFELDKGDDLEEALEWWKTLHDVCDGAGRGVDPEEDDGEEDAKWLDDALDVSDVDAKALLDAWQKAIATIDPQLNKLATAIKGVGDPRLDEIADKGIQGMTAGFRTKLQAALLEARFSSGARQDKALKKAVSLADKFVDVVYDDPRFEACDRNDFGVTVTLRKSLGTALRFIANAA